LITNENEELSSVNAVSSASSQQLHQQQPPPPQRGKPRSLVKQILHECIMDAYNACPTEVAETQEIYEMLRQRTFGMNIELPTVIQCSNMISMYRSKEGLPSKRRLKPATDDGAPPQISEITTRERPPTNRIPFPKADKNIFQWKAPTNGKITRIAIELIEQDPNHRNLAQLLVDRIKSQFESRKILPTIEQVRNFICVQK